MKPAIILFALLTIVLGVICLHERQTAHDQLTVAHEQILSTSNDLRAVQSELTMVKTQAQVQAQAQAITVTQLVQQVATLDAAKTTAETERQQAQQQAKGLKQDLADARNAIEAEKNQLATLDKEKETLVAESAKITAQLRDVTQQLATLDKSHSATVTQLSALRDQQAILEMEKVSLEARMNSLDALKAQIRVVKKQIWDEKVATRKRQDAEAAATGNHGFLMLDGQGRDAAPTAQPSLRGTE